MWWARQDSNLQPDRDERPALTIELQAPREPVGPVVPDRLQGGPLRCNGGLGPIQAFCEQDEGLGYLVAAMHRWREPLAGSIGRANSAGPALPSGLVSPH